MTGAANYDIASRGRGDACGARLIVVSESRNEEKAENPESRR
jgi:hypothetical protein